MRSNKIKTPINSMKTNSSTTNDTNNIPKKKWKQVISTIKTITSKIQTLSLDKCKSKNKIKCFSKKNSLKNSKTTKNLKKINTQNSIECPHKSNPRTPCYYLKQYQKLKKRNQVLQIQKATLQKLILHNSKQKVPQNKIQLKKGKQNFIQSFFSLKYLKNNNNKICKAKQQDKNNFRKLKNNNLKLQINDQKQKTFYSQSNNIKDLTMTTNSNKQQCSIRKGQKNKKQYVFNKAMQIYDNIVYDCQQSNLKKLQNQFNRLLQLNRVQKNKLNKISLRKQMQEIAKKIKIQKS